MTTDMKILELLDLRAINHFWNAPITPKENS